MGAIVLFGHKNKTPEGVFVVLINKKTPRQKSRRIPGRLKNRHTVLKNGRNKNLNTLY